MKTPNLKQLNNTYIGLRHGESKANVAGIIVSKPENGIPKYGLSDRGRQQVEHSINQAISSQVLNQSLDANTIIICSDFKRAFETAQIAHTKLACKNELILDARLRERDFGDFELQANTHYQTVWDNDIDNPDHTLNNAESANSVQRRALALLSELESQHSQKIILLVAHGDTLQILQTAFEGRSASEQRALLHWETAELRGFGLSF